MRSSYRELINSLYNNTFTLENARNTSSFWLKIKVFQPFWSPGSVTDFFYFQPIFFSAKMLFASSAALGFSNQNSQYRIAIDTWVLFNSSQYRSPLRRRVLYPAELWRHMPQTLDFTGFLGFFPSAIYKIINSFSSCQSTDFFDLVTLERSPNWGMLCCHL